MITDKNSVGIYVHIPFCLSKCAYCDFYSLPCSASTEELKEKYTDALIRQAYALSERYGSPSADTVYIGGGTPTVLSDTQLSRIVSALKSAFDLTRNREFTVEANPATFDAAKLSVLKKSGVNRISLGIQSTSDKELKAVGRAHTFEEAKSAFELTRKCGFDNISTDIIYGLPYQTRATLTETVRKIIDLSPEHISLYGLQLEENTPLYRKKDTLPFPSDDEAAEMFSEAIDILASAGYTRYEISNFAKKDKASLHNLSYWRQMPYLGLGAGAYSFFNGRRFHTEGDAYRFASASDFDTLSVTDETLDEDELEKEFIMLSLRLCDGFSVKELNDRTRNPDLYLNRIAPFIENGLLKNENGRIFFTRRGFDVSNAVLSEILF